jgi:NAD(P) transhydrogenase subunit alpha
MIIGVPKEIFPGERRVALVPTVLPALAKAGYEVVIEAGAGTEAGYLDKDFTEKGAKVAASRKEVFATADIIVQVLCHGSNDRTGKEDLPLFRPGQALIGFLRPLGRIETIQEIAATGVTAFAVELMPRITRAQNMDALSSMATICGYKAVVLAANQLPKLFPMLTTAAGTLTAAKVFVIGAGVAGLQAIATAKRMGAVVSAYDLRPAVKEQVQSVGGRFVELPLEVTQAQDERGYARAQDETFYQKQRELLGRVVAESDVVITTAVVPGKKPPVLITRDMVERMAPGSVIVDLAAERGGNCELTKASQVAVEHRVAIFGYINLASYLPCHASLMYAKNITAFLLNMTREKKLVFNLEDEIVRDTMLVRDGEITSALVRQFFQLPALQKN